MDPIATLRSCLQLAREIYDLKQKMDADDAACNMFFARVQSLTPPLERLNHHSQQSLGSKKVSLEQINECLNNILRIANYRVNQKNSVVGFLKKVHESYTGSLKENLSELNLQLDRCISTLTLCITVDGDSKLDEVATSQQVQAVNDSLACKLDDIAAALQAQSLSSSVESQFQRDPYPEDFDDVQSVLGRGAFGVTHRMKNIVDLGVYAVKVIRVKDAESAGINKDAMIREATTLRNLNHKYLVRYYTSYFSKNCTFFNLVMELVSGGSLDDKIKDQSVTVTMIRQWLVQLADVLSYLHVEKRLLHRDIKPDNILLTASGSSSIQLIDLGMACVYESSLSKMSKAGTQTYSSYEKAHGVSYDGRDDVWGAGCVFGELLTKSRLTERGGSLYEHNNAEVNRRRLSLIEDCIAVHSELGSLLSQMLECDVSKRITSQVLLAELTRSVSGTSLQSAAAELEVPVPKSVVSSVDELKAISTTNLLSVSSSESFSVPITKNTAIAVSDSTSTITDPQDTRYSNSVTLTGHTRIVRSLVSDVSRNRLYSGSADKTIKVWNMSSHACVATLTGHTHEVRSLVCDVSRDRLYSGSEDKSIKVWDMSSHACVATLTGHTGFVWSLMLDVSRGRLYSGSGDNSIRVWDMSSHACVATLTGHIGCVYSLVCDLSRDRLYSGSADKTIKVWNMSSHACVATLTGHTFGACSLVCDMSRDRLYSGSADKSIKVWDMSSHACVATLTGHTKAVWSLMLDVSGGRLYSGSWDMSIRVWDMSSHACVVELTGHTEIVLSLVYDVSRDRLYSGSWDKSIKVWDMSSHACVATLTGHTSDVISLVCDVSRDRLCTGSFDRSIKVWDMSSHACVATLTGHNGLVLALVCDVRRDRLYSGSGDNSIRVWDMSSQACVATLTGHTHDVRSLVCDMSRCRLYSGSADTSIKVWDMSSHACVATLTGHTDWVWSLVCDVSRDRLYSGSADKSIKVWDMSSQACVATLFGHTGDVISLVCDVSRDRLYSGSIDKSIKVWSV